MALKDTAYSMVYQAFDKTANSPKTGDAANHTLYVIADGIPNAVDATPVEIDATNLPGLYRVTVAADENVGVMMALGGKSSTSGVDISPIQWTNQVETGKLSAAAITQIEGIIDSKLNAIADAILGRSVSGSEATAAEHSLVTLILMHLEAVTSDTTLQIRRSNGSTVHLTKTLTLDADGLPIIGIGD